MKVRSVEYSNQVNIQVVKDFSTTSLTNFSIHWWAEGRPKEAKKTMLIYEFCKYDQISRIIR